MNIKHIAGCLLLILPVSCRQPVESDSSGSQGLIPVTITHASLGTLTDAVVLNATSSFLIKTEVKSDVNGYLYKVDIQPGQKIIRSQEIFVIRSKEAEHLGSTIAKLDTSFRFTGQVAIHSPVDGYVSQLSHTVDDYVQDGEVLVTISDLNSLVFLLNLPYELKPFLPANKTVELTLPDGQILHGTLALSIPAVDPVSQTQAYVIHVPGGLSIPENLIASVKFIKKSRPNVIMLPSEAVLTNEVQSEFWIMKMTDSTTAVKVPIVKGLETVNDVEIISPALSPDDLILLTGNYGLPDTAHVVIENRK
jgi:multidrug efflux pump subunit AcrA (membrane-fusion protein)